MVKIYKLPDLNADYFYMLLGGSYHTIEELAEIAPTVAGIKLLKEKTGLGLLEAKNIPEAARLFMSQPEKPTDDFVPSLDGSIEIERIPVIDESTQRKLSDASIRTLNDFFAATDSPSKREGLAKKIGISERRLNKIIVAIELLGTPVEHHPKGYLIFVTDLLTKIDELPDINKKTVDALNKHSVYTVLDLLEAAGDTTESMNSLSDKTGIDLATISKIILDAKNLVGSPVLGSTAAKSATASTGIDQLTRVFDLASIDDKTRSHYLFAPMKNLDDLRNATRTIDARNALSVDTGLDIGRIQLLAMYADLLSVPKMTIEDATLLIGIGGIYSVSQLAKIEIKTSAEARRFSVGELKGAKIIHYSDAARKMNTGFEFVEKEAPAEETAVATGDYVSISVSDMITQLGSGIGQAQRELDMHAIETQKSILRNREMAEYGLNATWFTMPEIDFSLRMEYTVSESKTEEGTVPVRTIDLIPSNAKYNNMFSADKTEESVLTIKFVPVPPAELFIERLMIPDLMGMTLKEAREELSSLNIRGDFYDVTAFDADDVLTEVTYQSIEPGRYLQIGEVFLILVEPRT